MARTQDTQPVVVNKDAATLVDNGAHWGASGDLHIDQRTRTSGVVRRRQNLHGIGGLGNPLLNQRPTGVVYVN